MLLLLLLPLLLSTVLLQPQVCLQMEATHPDSFAAKLPPGYESAAVPYHRPPVRGVQFHHDVPAADDGSAEVGKDYRHMSADLQVSYAHPVCVYMCVTNTECNFCAMNYTSCSIGIDGCLSALASAVFV
jgi:hypothetical protein